MFDADSRRRILRGSGGGEDGLSEVRARHAEVADLSPLQQAAYIDIKTWLCDDVLVKVDRATMASSLESRAPFLDHRIAEFALRLPDSWKITWTTKKRILKRAFAERLPPETLKRKKRGFNAPVSHWIVNEFREVFLDNARSGRASERLDPAYAEALLTEHAEKRADHGYRLFNLMCLSVWLNHSPALGDVEVMQGAAQ
jgi:asparagine synthase (glutamine-hydrolysing)